MEFSGRCKNWAVLIVAVQVEGVLWKEMRYFDDWKYLIIKDNLLAI